ncbi:MAG: NAD(P)-dependent oxidoreductase [Pseudomonadota bacterium]
MTVEAATNRLDDGIVDGRLTSDELQDNFSDVHPPLNPHEALVASDRCYFCYDAPCVTACPTEIDIPLFIRQISTGNDLGAAETILEQNILGGMCARVCPTETLCEQACVRELAEGKPVQIGLLQRHATDLAMAQNVQFFERAADTGKSIAVVGAGPAGLACAHRLSMHGHTVTIFEAQSKPGGLNEFGIAAYKTVDEFAQHEVDYITAIGGIDIRYGQRLGSKISLEQLRADHDAVFLGMGLGGVNGLGLDGVDGESAVMDAVDFIANLRQAKDKRSVPIGRRVVVIGGGMTAVDAAVQSKLLGAEEVTICYRRGQEDMNASRYEQELATSKGVVIRHWVQPKALNTSAGTVTDIQFEYTAMGDGKLVGTGRIMTLPADQVLTAIGQKLEVEDLPTDSPAKIELTGGRIAIFDAAGRTSLEDVWAGGDCAAGGDDLTVTAVAEGRDAAEAITAFLAD